MKALLPWFAANRRALPWREEPREAYRVWVSEVMLQQTRVETVLRYYAPFLRAFPDARALAAAPEERLMKAWEGLGYYRRARLLQQGARHVVERGMPTSFAGWLEVPGVGPYTAGAIASLAQGEAVPAVDGNVLRVFSRVAASELDVATPAARRAAEAWVRANQPRDAPGAFNEALMELGATVCAPTSPRCEACPLAAACEGRARGLAARLPVKAAKAPAREVVVRLALARRGERLLLERREEGLLAGTWGLPWVEGTREDLAARVEALAGAPVALSAAPVATGRHVFTHRVWRMEAYAAQTTGRRGEWRAPEEVALGTAHRRLLGLTGARPPRSP